MEQQIIINETDFSKARAKINNSKTEIVFTSDNDELNRKILEKAPKIKILLINLSNRQDYSKQRNSGLDNPMAKLAKSNKIIIGINLDEITEEKKQKTKSEILARLKQNIDICKRNKLQMKFIAQKKESERNIYDLKSLGLILGMHTEMVKGL